MPSIHKDIVVSGVVQGVGFRYSCKRIARTYGIKGYVSNLSNGNVFIEAEGNETAINMFIKWCYSGPANARVSDVSITDSDTKNYKEFDIKY